MSFKPVFSSKSYRQIKDLDNETRDRIKKAIEEIAENPWHKGTIKIEGHEGIRRKRVGKYRILYLIDKERNEVLIVKIERRSETTYKNL